MKQSGFSFYIMILLITGFFIHFGCKTAPVKSSIVSKVNLLPTVMVHDTAQENSYKVLILHNPQTFEICNVYEKADTASKVLEKLKPFTSFKQAQGVEVEVPDTIHGSDDMPDQYSTTPVVWAEVTTLNGTKGYIQPHKIANWTYENPALHVRYLIGNYVKGKNRDWMTRFAKLDLSQGKIVSQVECFANSSEYQTYINVIKNLPLKNAQMALRLYAHGDFCGGGDNGIMMLDTPYGLALIPSSNTFYDDGGGILNTKAYFPTVNKKGELKLYADAESDDKVNRPSVIPYPKDTKIPLEELIVVNSEDGQYAVDDDERPITGKNGKEKLLNLVKTTVYYRWNGQRIEKVLEKKVKVK